MSQTTKIGVRTLTRAVASLLRGGTVVVGAEIRDGVLVIRHPHSLVAHSTVFGPRSGLRHEHGVFPPSTPERPQ
jgi:hypothetical protein